MIVSFAASVTTRAIEDGGGLRARGGSRDAEYTGDDRRQA